MAIHQFLAVGTSGDVPKNIAADWWCKESKYPRQVVRIGFAGSAAAGDVSFDLYFQDRKVAENLFPTSVGAVLPDDDDMLALAGGEICPPGVEIRLVPSGLATTNPVYGIIETKERPDLLRMFKKGY